MVALLGSPNNWLKKRLNYQLMFSASLYSKLQKSATFVRITWHAWYHCSRSTLLSHFQRHFFCCSDSWLCSECCNWVLETWSKDELYILCYKWPVVWINIPVILLHNALIILKKSTSGSPFRDFGCVYSHSHGISLLDNIKRRRVVASKCFFCRT